jgi:probable aminopeptidase NPEPL1
MQIRLENKILILTGFIAYIFSEFSSTVADMKNSVADRSNAAPSCAGLFINAHLGFDFPGAWLHVDMASPVSVGKIP